MTARATLTIRRLPDLHPEARRLEVDCPAATTGVTTIPSGPINLPDEHLLLIAAWTHEERCGECDLTAVLDQGDQAMRELVERLVTRYEPSARVC